MPAADSSFPSTLSFVLFSLSMAFFLLALSAGGIQEQPGCLF